MGGYRDQIRLLLPRKYFFYEYDVFPARHRKEKEGARSFQYHLHSDEVPLVEPIDEADFDYSLSRADKKGFELTAPGKAMQFKMKYQGLSFRPFQSRNDPGELKYSTWYITGDLDETVSFTFPDIPLYHEDNFESLKSIGGRDPYRMQVIKPLGGRSRVIVAAPIMR